MDVKEEELSPQLKALKKMNISILVRIGGLMLPRVLKGFLPILDEKQRSAFDKVMPVGGGKRIFIHLVGTPTPPIVIGLAQPLKMSTMREAEVKQQQIKGIKLTINDLQLLTGRRGRCCGLPGASRDRPLPSWVWWVCFGLSSGWGRLSCAI